MQATALYGVGLTTERLEEIATAAGTPARAVVSDLPVDRAIGLAGAIVLAVTLDEEDLVEALRRGAGACIETAELDLSGLAALVRQADACLLFLSMTTATAYRLQLAQGIVLAIDRRRSLPQDRRDDMELALQEAVSNAVIHGNLRVQSLQDPSLAALDAYSADVGARLADPDLANRRIQVIAMVSDTDQIMIDVIDQGPGFVPTPRQGIKPSGRGIGLIQTLASAWELLDDGRRMRMRFDL